MKHVKTVSVVKAKSNVGEDIASFFEDAWDEISSWFKKED